MLPPSQFQGRYSVEDRSFEEERSRRVPVLPSPGAPTHDPPMFDRPDDFDIDRRSISPSGSATVCTAASERRWRGSKPHRDRGVRQTLAPLRSRRVRSASGADVQRHQVRQRPGPRESLAPTFVDPHAATSGLRPPFTPSPNRDVARLVATEERHIAAMSSGRRHVAGVDRVDPRCRLPATLSPPSRAASGCRRRPGGSYRPSIPFGPNSRANHFVNPMTPDLAAT